MIGSHSLRSCADISSGPQAFPSFTEELKAFLNDDTSGITCETHGVILKMRD